MSLKATILGYVSNITINALYKGQPFISFLSINENQKGQSSKFTIEAEYQRVSGKGWIHGIEPNIELPKKNFMSCWQFYLEDLP